MRDPELAGHHLSAGRVKRPASRRLVYATPTTRHRCCDAARGDRRWLRLIAHAVQDRKQGLQIPSQRKYRGHRPPAEYRRRNDRRSGAHPDEVERDAQRQCVASRPWYDLRQCVPDDAGLLPLPSHATDRAVRPQQRRLAKPLRRPTRQAERAPGLATACRGMTRSGTGPLRQTNNDSRPWREPCPWASSVKGLHWF